MDRFVNMATLKGNYVTAAFNTITSNLLLKHKILLANYKYLNKMSIEL